jgi:Pyruvate/2-oxoacid:ferredoxin oxidoreductase gamma subunit
MNNFKGRSMVKKSIKELEHVTIRFAGDSGDGMQLTGNQFTRTTALSMNDLSTFPDFPAEIRAPAGSDSKFISAARKFIPLEIKPMFWLQ